jgi:hypothetical protein
MNKEPLNVLFLGASFGVVLGMRIAAAGHRVTFACRGPEAALINQGKLILRVATKQHTSPLDIAPSHCRIAPVAALPHDIDPRRHDLVCLAMQEPQYSSPGVRDLIERIAAAGVPCLSIMNMPLPPYLEKIEVAGGHTANPAFTESELWKDMDPAVFTMASSDPQAKRLDVEGSLLISVTLPTNFKVAPFERPRDQAMLEGLADDIDGTRIEHEGALCQPCVRLRPHASNHIPLSKWPMLITGNFRCLSDGPPLSIGQAVSRNLNESRELYEWITEVCLALGAEKSIMVPFDVYLAAAEALTLPSSLARGLFAGAIAAERVDVLIQALAGRHGMSHPVLDRIVGEISAVLEKNRSGQPDPV